MEGIWSSSRGGIDVVDTIHKEQAMTWIMFIEEMGLTYQEYAETRRALGDTPGRRPYVLVTQKPRGALERLSSSIPDMVYNIGFLLLLAFLGTLPMTIPILGSLVGIVIGIGVPVGILLSIVTGKPIVTWKHPTKYD